MKHSLGSISVMSRFKSVTTIFLTLVAVLAVPACGVGSGMGGGWRVLGIVRTRLT